MALMMGSLYQALRSSNVEGKAARKTAEAVPACEDRFTNVDRRLVEVKGEIKQLKWMVGFVLAFCNATLNRLFTT